LRLFQECSAHVIEALLCLQLEASQLNSSQLRALPLEHLQCWRQTLQGKCESTLERMQVGASHPPRAAPASDSATEAEDATSADRGRGADILVKHTFQSNNDAHERAQRGTSVDTSRAEALKGLAFLVDSPKGVAVRLLTGVRCLSPHPNRGPD
jgi:hypothetical protein